LVELGADGTFRFVTPPLPPTILETSIHGRARTTDLCGSLILDNGHEDEQASDGGRVGNGFLAAEGEVGADVLRDSAGMPRGSTRRLGETAPGERDVSGNEVLAEIGTVREENLGVSARIPKETTGGSEGDVFEESGGTGLNKSEGKVFGDLGGKVFVEFVHLSPLESVESNTVRCHVPNSICDVRLKLPAYILYDCGALGSFVSEEFLKMCEQVCWSIPMHPGRRLDIMTAGALEACTVPAAHLTVPMGSFIHTRWFLVYPLLGYDIILGKDFMEEIPQEIDLSTNILSLPNCMLKGLGHDNRDRVGPPLEGLSL
jgi:hypothetical protein